MLEDGGEHLLDHHRGEAMAARTDVAEHVVLADDLNCADLLLDAFSTSENDDRAHLSGRQADIGQGCLALPGQVGQVVDLVGDVGLITVDAPRRDEGVLPRLGVDDEYAGGTDDDQIHLGSATPRPLSVGQEVVSDGVKGSQHERGALFGCGRSTVVLGGESGTTRFEFMRLGEGQLALCLKPRGLTCRHPSPLRDAFIVAR